MRRVRNPRNPFLSTHSEWLGPAPKVATEVYEERAKSILVSNDSPDIPFRWSVNPYRGCQHACTYCYARPTHEYLGLGAGTDFESKITVKVNAPELLERALARSSWPRDEVVFSGVTDCYQPYEAVYELTRRCLEVCLRHDTPIGIVTKGYLIVRDCELLATLARQAGAMVYMSIAFADDATARAVDVGAPPPSRRFEAMRQLHDAGVPVGLMLSPVIPGLNDREIPAVLERAAACGARAATFTALRLPGSVQEYFRAQLADAMPDAARRVEARIQEMRGGQWTDSRFGHRMRGDGNYWESIRRLFAISARRFGVQVGSAPPKPPARRATSRKAPRDASTTQLPLFPE